MPKSDDTARTIQKTAMKEWHAKQSEWRARHQRQLASETYEVSHNILGKDRLIALTDAILAIIMTILVLELPKPKTMTWTGLWELRTSFFAYAISFFWIGALWSSLNRIWEHVRRVGNSAVVLSLILLFFASLMPYATSLESENYHNSVMQAFYGIVVILITLSNYVLHWVIDHSNRDNPVLLTITYSYRRELIPDISIKIAGLVLSLTVWAPAMMWSVLVAAAVILTEQRLTRKKTAAYLDQIRERCERSIRQKEKDEAAHARTAA